MQSEQHAAFVPPEASRSYTSAPLEPPSADDVAPGSRRRLATTKTSFVPPNDITPFPLLDANHSFVLLNLTHHGQRPRSRYPGFRIMGAFPSVGAVTQHIQDHFPNSDCSMYVTPSHQLMAICENTAHQIDGAYNQGHVARLATLHNQLSEQRDTEFAENVDRQSTGSTGNSLFAKCHIQGTDTKDDAFLSAARELKETSTLTSNACLPKQNYAVIITLSDIDPEALRGTKAKEPLLAVLGVFSTEEDAANYAKYTASKQYPKCILDVVDLYAWCFPENIDVDKIKEVYGSDELNDIMQGRKDNMNITNKFKEWCDENHITPKYTDLDEKSSQGAATVDEQLSSMGKMVFES